MVDSSGSHAINKVPRKIAPKAGVTDAATARMGLPNMAEAKKMFRPAGGHKNPISIAAKKMMPKCTGPMP